jgi:hypothetical protein
MVLLSRLLFLVNIVIDRWRFFVAERRESRRPKKKHYQPRQPSALRFQSRDSKLKRLDPYPSSALMLKICKIGSGSQFRNFLRFSNSQISRPKVHPNDLLMRVEAFRNSEGSFSFV